MHTNKSPYTWKTLKAPNGERELERQMIDYRSVQEGNKAESLTNLGAIREDKVMVFSGVGPALLLVMAVITKQSPDGTALTLPLYHPVAAPADDDAISTAKINLPTRSTN